MSCSQTDVDNAAMAKIKEMIQGSTDPAQQQQLQNIFNSMGLPSNRMNGIVANLQSMITCDTDCQKRKKTDELRRKWMAAKEDLATAPSNVQSTEKAYYVFKDGEVGYRQMLVDRYTKVANKRSTAAKASHHELMEELDTLLSDYTAEVASAKRLRELLNIRLTENRQLSLAVDSDVAAVQTNDRRVVYEDWAQGWLHTVKRLFTIIYIVLSVVLLYTGSFFQKKGYATVKGWLLPIGLVAFPFIVSWLVRTIGTAYQTAEWYADNKAPKDVYTGTDQ